MISILTICVNKSHNRNYQDEVNRYLLRTRIYICVIIISKKVNANEKNNLQYLALIFFTGRVLFCCCPCCFCPFLPLPFFSFFSVFSSFSFFSIFPLFALFSFFSFFSLLYNIYLVSYSIA